VIVLKRFLVTGASKGFGRILTEKLLERGYMVVGVARSRDVLEELSKEYENFEYIACDLTKLECIDKVYEHVSMDGIDVLINNVGASVYGYLTDLDPEVIEYLTKVNFLTPTILTSKLVPLIRDNGVIVYVLTYAIYALMLGLSIYVSTKTGLDKLADHVEEELRDRGRNIRIVRAYYSRMPTSFWEHPSFKDKKIDFKPVTDPEKAADKLIKCIQTPGCRKVYEPWWLGIVKPLLALRKPIIRIE